MLLEATPAVVVTAVEVNANWLAAKAPADVCKGQVVNIACRERTSLNQILQKLNKLLTADVKAIYKPARKGDVKHSLADISLAKSTIGYRPTVFFEDGLGMQ